MSTNKLADDGSSTTNSAYAAYAFTSEKTKQQKYSKMNNRAVSFGTRQRTVMANSCECNHRSGITLAPHHRPSAILN